MSDKPSLRLVNTDPGDHAPPVPSPAPRHLLTAWFGLLALGGVAFGLYAQERPFGRGFLAHPLIVFFAAVAAGLLTLRFVSTRPVTALISLPNLVAGIVIGVVCFFIGDWFGINLVRMP